MVQKVKRLSLTAFYCLLICCLTQFLVGQTNQKPVANFPYFFKLLPPEIVYTIGQCLKGNDPALLYLLKFVSLTQAQAYEWLKRYLFTGHINPKSFFSDIYKYQPLLCIVIQSWQDRQDALHNAFKYQNKRELEACLSEQIGSLTLLHNLNIVSMSYRELKQYKNMICYYKKVLKPLCDSVNRYHKRKCIADYISDIIHMKNNLGLANMTFCLLYMFGIFLYTWKACSSVSYVSQVMPPECVIEKNSQCAYYWDNYQLHHTTKQAPITGLVCYVDQVAYYDKDKAITLNLLYSYILCLLAIETMLGVIGAKLIKPKPLDAGIKRLLFSYKSIIEIIESDIKKCFYELKHTN